MALVNASDMTVKMVSVSTTDATTDVCTIDKVIPASASDILLSVSAADKVASLIAEEKNLNLNLRVYITGGGCSGYQYGFTFDEVIAEDDTIIIQTCSDQKTLVKLLVDCISVQLLAGAEIDFTTGIQEQFVIRNPNAKTTCGCGSSFSVDDEDDEDNE